MPGALSKASRYECCRCLSSRRLRPGRRATVHPPLVAGGLGALGTQRAPAPRSVVRTGSMSASRIERLTAVLHDAVEQARAGAWTPFPDYSHRLVHARLKARARS